MSVIFAEAVPWSNVVLILGLAVSFVAFCWVVGHHGGASVEFKDRPPEWRYERTAPKEDEQDG